MKFSTVGNCIEVAENIIEVVSWIVEMVIQIIEVPRIIYDWAERSNYVLGSVIGPMAEIIEPTRIC